MAGVDTGEVGAASGAAGVAAGAGAGGCGLVACAHAGALAASSNAMVRAAAQITVLFM